MKEIKKKNKILYINLRNLVFAFLVLLIGGTVAIRLLCRFWEVCF